MMSQTALLSPYGFSSIEQQLYPLADEKIGAHFGPYILSSHFQPVYSLAHRRIVGFEALLRTRENGLPIPPNILFERMVHDEARLVALDRTCRAMHTANFVKNPHEHQWLFLNCEPNAFIHPEKYGRFFLDMLEHYAISPDSVVVEILETHITNEGKLSEAVNYAKAMGCLIALDDFGAGHSNIDRIWRLEPDIVKLDRSLIVAAASDNPKAKRLLNSLVGMIHEAGALVLIEGVETDHEAMTAIESDCDFVQGYFFGRPSPEWVDGAVATTLCDRLWGEFAQKECKTQSSESEFVRKHSQNLVAVAHALERGEHFDTAAGWFLKEEEAIRCYLLDHKGQQLSVNVDRDAHALNIELSKKMAPLANARGAIWSRRTYFRRAIHEPNRIQVSRPYLSMTEAQLCLTLSIAFELHEKMVVLCGDIRDIT